MCLFIYLDWFITIFFTLASSYFSFSYWVHQCYFFKSEQLRNTNKHLKSTKLRFPGKIQLVSIWLSQIKKQNIYQIYLVYVFFFCYVVFSSIQKYPLWSWIHTQFISSAHINRRTEKKVPAAVNCWLSGFTGCLVTVCFLESEGLNRLWKIHKQKCIPTTEQGRAAFWGAARLFFQPYILTCKAQLAVDDSNVDKWQTLQDIWCDCYVWLVMNATSHSVLSPYLCCGWQKQNLY